MNPKDWDVRRANYIELALASVRRELEYTKTGRRLAHLKRLNRIMLDTLELLGEKGVEE